jgi:tetratricopeptide (TPR) repeat protein
LRLLSKPKAAVGDYAGGLKDLGNALILAEELAQQFPKDFRIQRAVWLTRCLICELFIDEGDGARAVESGLGIIDFPKRALEKEPENGVIAYDLAISYFNLARAYRLGGDFQKTITNADSAIEVMSGLSAKSPSDSDYKRNLAIYQTEMAGAHIALRQSEPAIVALEHANEILQPIVKADPNSTTTLGDLGTTYRFLAQAHHLKREDLQANELIDKAIAITRDLIQRQAVRDTDKNTLAELEMEKATYAR